MKKSQKPANRKQSSVLGKRMAGMVKGPPSKPPGKGKA